PEPQPARCAVGVALGQRVQVQAASPTGGYVRTEDREIERSRNVDVREQPSTLLRELPQAHLAPSLTSSGAGRPTACPRTPDQSSLPPRSTWQGHRGRRATSR